MFDVVRFRRLLAVHWAEQGRSYLWFLAIGIAVHLCIWLLLSSAGMGARTYSLDTQAILYYVGYVVTSVLFASRYYAGLARRESALTLLMRPASALEKSLLAFLMVAVFYPLAYTLAFQVVNLPGAWLGESAHQAFLRKTPPSEVVEFMRKQQYGPFLPFTGKASPWPELDVLLCTAGVQALVLAGAIRFHRVAWLKTLVGLFVFVVVALPLAATLADGNPGLLMLSTDPGGPTHGLLAWKWAVLAGVPLLFWLATYFLLRERELQ